MLKRNITGLCEVEILKLSKGLFTRKESDGTKNDTARFLAFEATPYYGIIIRIDTRFSLSIFVTQALSPTLLWQNHFDVDVSCAYEF